MLLAVVEVGGLLETVADALSSIAGGPLLGGDGRSGDDSDATGDEAGLLLAHELHSSVWITMPAPI